MADFSHKFYCKTQDALHDMYEAILLARESIYWEIYSLIDDNIGLPFVEALCTRAQAGLEVKIIIDAIGSMEMSRLSVSRLRGAGVDVLYYNSLIPDRSFGRWVRKLWQRNHRKLLVIDKETVFIGGVNVASIYSQWHDLHVRITGCIVTPLLQAFAKSYVCCGGDKKNVKHLFKYNIKTDFNKLRNHYRFVLHSPVNIGKSYAKQFYFDSLATAKESFNLLTPYFVPDKNFFKLMYEAKERGVKVNLFFPVRPDFRILTLVADVYYRLARRVGASIFLSPKMNHGKALSADARFGFVGSFNFTRRSFYYHEEAGLFFDNQSMVHDLDLIFDDLRASSIELSADTSSNIGSIIKNWLGKRIGEWI